MQKLFPTYLYLLLFSLTVIFYKPIFAVTPQLGLYTYETSKGMKVGGVFGEIPLTEKDDVLISVSSPSCSHVEIHTMIETQDGIMQMREIKSLPVKGGEIKKLEPIGYHIMLINLNAPLEYGKFIELELNFQKSGSQKITVPILSRRTRP